jgi:hypothetical protein
MTSAVYSQSFQSVAIHELHPIDTEQLLELLKVQLEKATQRDQYFVFFIKALAK